MFTVTLVLLAQEENRSAASESILLLAMKDALLNCLTANIKFKLAVEKWTATGATADKINEFVNRASENFMVKQLAVEKLIKGDQQ